MELLSQVQKQPHRDYIGIESSNVAVKIVKYICCNNAGENVALERACKQEGLGIKFE